MEKSAKEMELHALCQEYNYLAQLRRERELLTEQIKIELARLEEKYPFLHGLHLNLDSRIEDILNLIKSEVGEKLIKLHKERPCEL